jgi:hypothetical protein
MMIVVLKVKSVVQNVMASLHVKTLFNLIVGTHHYVNQTHKKGQVLNEKGA